MSLGRANLVVKVTASLDEMKKEMAKAETIIATTESAMRRMSNAFDPQKTIANANAAMKQIQDLKGVTGLTEQQQRRLNQVVSEGVAAYQALGRQAPAEMIALRDATAKAIPETDKLGTSAGSLTDKLKGAAGALGLAFGASAVIGGIKSLVSNTLDYASTIDDTSKKLGISIEATQRYKFAAEQTGASLENVAKSVLKLSQQLAGGDKGVKEALDAAGLSFDAIRAMGPEQAFDATVVAIQRIPDPMTQARIAMELFGKGGAEILPAIREGFAGIAKGADVMKDETIRRLAEAEDVWAKVKNRVVIMSGEMISAIADVFTRRDDRDLKSLNPAQYEEFWKRWNAGAGDHIKYLRETVKANNEAAAAAQAGAAVLSGSYMNAMRNLPPLTRATVELTDEQKAAQRESVRLAEAFQRQVDVLTGTALAREVDALAAQIKAAGKEGGITSHEMERLGKRLSEMQQAGATLPPELAKIAGAFEITQVKGLKLATTLESITTALRVVKGVSLSTPPWIDNLKGWSFSQGFGDGLIDPIAQLELLMERLGKSPEPGAAGAASGKQFAGAFGAALNNLGATIIGAIQGGGNIGKAIGASLLGGLGDDLGKLIAGKISGSLGRAIGSFAGPLGALLGSKIGGIVSGVFAGNNTQKDREAAARAMGFTSLSAMNAALNALGVEGQRLVDEGLNRIGKTDAAANERWIASVKALLDKTSAAAAESTRKLAEMRGELATLQSQSTPTFADMEAAAREFGVSLEHAGQGFQQMRLDAEAKRIIDGFDTMKRGGMDVGNTINGMSDELQAFVQNSLKFKTTVPENMRWMLEASLNAGYLIDENGKKLTDLSRINFGEPVKSKWDIIGDAITKLIASIDKMVAQLAGPVIGTVGNVAEAFRRLPAGMDFNIRTNFGMPSAAFGGAMAEGGSGLVTRPTWFLAGEAGPERYAFTPARGGASATAATVHVTINNPSIRHDRDIQEMTRQVVREIPRHLKEIGAV